MNDSLPTEKRLSDLDILHHPKEYIISPDNRTMKNGYSVYNTGSTMNDLVSGNKKNYGAKQILLSVCDGYFVKHPTKNYIDD